MKPESLIVATLVGSLLSTGSFAEVSLTTGYMDFVVHPVPEPSTWVLLAAFGVILGCLARPTVFRIRILSTCFALQTG
jgi:hypothetical protein